MKKKLLIISNELKKVNKMCPEKQQLSNFFIYLFQQNSFALKDRPIVGVKQIDRCPPTEVEVFFLYSPQVTVNITTDSDKVDSTIIFYLSNASILQAKFVVLWSIFGIFVMKLFM